MTLPDFLVVGAPKAGTTALHAALARHPDLFLSTVKEPMFFLGDGAGPPLRTGQRGPGDAHSAREWVWHPDRYRELFAAAPPGARTGESTPFYLWSRRAHHRIARALPDVKLIAVVRDPVDRAYSNWAHLRSDGLEPIGDFLEACAAEEDRAERGWAPFWRYKGLGRYGEQLAHLYSRFPAAQIHVLRYRDLVEQPMSTLDDICRFLGVEPGLLDVAPSENVSVFADDTPLNTGIRALVRTGAAVGAAFPPQVWRRASRPLIAALKHRAVPRPELSRSDRALLASQFAEDIAWLTELTGDDYSDWLTHRTGTSYTARAGLGPSAPAAVPITS
jgi:hypothetical protein